jgi:Putative Ig domain
MSGSAPVSGRRRLILGLIMVSALVAFLGTGTARAWGRHRCRGVSISGSPAGSVVAGQSHRFTPSTANVGGFSNIALSFSVQNEPAWASFSIASGELAGAPATTDVGTYANIIISVSDGTGSVSLPAFSITVSAPQTATTGEAPLTWSAPTTNTDGTPISYLSGYDVYYGTSQTALTKSVQVAGPAMTSCVIGSLPAGTWYFAVTAYLADGTQSALSNVVSTTIQ